MKKLLLMPLIIGLFSACFAIPQNIDSHFGISPERKLQCVSLSIDQILHIAMYRFEEEYGLTFSITELHEKYVDGTLLLEAVGNDTYHVSLGGNGLIVDSEDFL